MSYLWLFFATLTVIGSVGFNIGMKLGASGTNPLFFLLVMTTVILVLLVLSCLVATYGFKMEVTQGMTLRAVKYAALCGFSAALIDVGYFLALRNGSMVSTQIFWTIGGMSLLTVIAVLFFHETITLTKALGIGFGVVSVWLITKAS